MSLELFDVADRLGKARDEARLAEWIADDLRDDELDLRIDAVRLSLLDALAWVDELILNGGPELEGVR